jgi:hypothetical protein
MRIHRGLAMVLLLSACAAPVSPPIADPPSASSPAASTSATPSTPAPSVDGHPLSELLPTAIAGVPTKTADLDPVTRDSPRVFLKVIARLGETPVDGEVALAFTSDATVYAVRVAGADGMDVLLAYLAERGYRADESPPTENVGGKQATRLGTLGGNFLYVKDDVFYFVNCKDDARAADLLALLP